MVQERGVKGRVTPGGLGLETYLSMDILLICMDLQIGQKAALNALGEKLADKFPLEFLLPPQWRKNKKDR